MSETEAIEEEPLPVLPTPTQMIGALLALLLPGMGHVYLGRVRRGILFFVLVVGAVVVGYWLQGNLWTPIEGRPLTMLATLGTMGMGMPYFVLNVFMDYEGVIGAAGYDYGTAFLTSAGLMNLLLVLDVLDISQGKKS